MSETPDDSTSQQTTATLVRAAFGDGPGTWPLPAASTPRQLWLRAVASGGQGRYGNAYADPGPRVPATLRDALAAWEGSELAKATFGTDVVEHYANYARVELAAFDAAVTDWELRRSFERL